MKRLIFVFLLSGFTLSLAGSQRPEGDTDIGFEPAVMVLANALGAAERVEVYEGLPNHFGEDKLFESEKRAKETRRIAGEWFYAKPQEAKLGDALALQRLIGAPLFKPWRGFKFCGGFHADFAMVLTTGKQTFQVLFCFGCHEAKIIRANEPFTADLNTVDFQLTTDLNEKSVEELRSLLFAYRKERPARAMAPSGR